jgi:hypothetical protein
MEKVIYLVWARKQHRLEICRWGSTVSANSQENKLRAILDWGRRPGAEQQEQLLFRHWPWQLNNQIRVYVEARSQAVHPILALLQDIARQILTLLTQPCAELWRRVPTPARGNSFPAATV